LTLSRISIALIALLLLSGVAAAQGCAMCYNNAAAADAQQRAALKRGIFMIGTPALLFLGGMIVVARRSDQEDTDDNDGD